VAASVCYVLEPTSEVETLDDLIFGRLAAMTRRLGWSFLPAFVCGPAFGYGWHIGVDSTLGQEEAMTVRRLLLDALEAEAAARGLQLSFAEVSDQEGELQTLLRERRYLRSRNVPVAALDLRWPSFDDYLEALPAKSRREFRRQINRNRNAGVVVERVDSVTGLEERLSELVDLNARKHNAFSFGLGPGFFGELTRTFGSNVRIFIARKSGGVAGVCVMLVQDGVAFPIVVGIDPASSSDYTYFHIAYNVPVADAIESGVQRMYYGRGMYDLKVRRGCVLIDTWIYSRAARPARMAIALWFGLASFWNRSKLSTRARRALLSPPS
jgi:predicted N-acyltransferase